jgi:hypothetical protein
MPVARIISTSFEDALKIAEYLSARFDTVEIAEPGRSYSGAVDLLVNLEVCTREEALARVSQIAEQPDVDIYIAPGTLVPATEQGVEQAAGNSGIPNLQPAVAASLPESMFAPPAERPMELAAEFSEVTQPASPVGASSSPTRQVQANAEAVRESWIVGLRAEFRKWWAQTLQEWEQWSAQRALLREIRQDERQRAQQQKREEEERRRAAFAAEQERRIALQQERLALEEAERGLQEQLELRAREEEHAPVAHVVEQQRPQEEILSEPVLAGATPGTEPTHSTHPRRLPVRRVARRSRRPASIHARRGRVAGVLAAASSVFIMLCLFAYANRRPASPVPAAVLQQSGTVQQQAPFGAQVVPASAHPSRANLIAVPDSVLPEKKAPSPELQKVKSLRVGKDEVEYLAEDVTVRHFNLTPERLHSAEKESHVRPSAAVAHIPHKPEVKQISDME